MKWYLDTLKKLVDSPHHKMTRAKVKGKQIGTKLIEPQMFSHDMRTGFPMITTKHVPFGLVASELQWFLSGSTRKEFLHKMDNHIWDEWYLGMNDKSIKDPDVMDVGRVYGAQWTRWQGLDRYYPATNTWSVRNINQVKNIIDQLKKDPTDRRMICLAWNPGELDQMALPTCHVMWQINYYGNNTIGLHWTQRSSDFMLGVPFNIASYGLLLELIAMQTGFEAGPLSGSFVDCHIYDNHLDAAQVQLQREPHQLPTLQTHARDGVIDLFKWKCQDSHLLDYEHDAKIPMEVAT